MSSSKIHELNLRDCSFLACSYNPNDTLSSVIGSILVVLIKSLQGNFTSQSVKVAFSLLDVKYQLFSYSKGLCSWPAKFWRNNLLTGYLVKNMMHCNGNS